MNNLTWTEDELSKAVSDSTSYAGVLRNMGRCVSSYNYKIIQKYIKLYELDTSHFKPYGHTNTKRIPLSGILVENSTYINFHNLKRRLIDSGLLEYRCSLCSLGDNWNGKPISLQLDHINGVRSDNRLQNLRLLCPNCHSQTDNYSGKSSYRSKVVKKKCKECGKDITPKATLCRACLSKSRVNRPVSKSELKELLDTNTFVTIGKMFNVSDNAVRKWAKKYNLI